MIQLRSDSLVFQTSSGDSIPCSVEQVAIELIGEAANQLDPEVVRNASAAVLHYFKYELGRTHVSMAEFSLALEQVLRGFGLSVETIDDPKNPIRVAEADLCQIACTPGKGLELFFFPRLRDELRRKLRNSPHVLRFRGLRHCAKKLAGTQRWNHRSQEVSEQIVEYLRTCLTIEPAANSCALVVL